MLATIAEFNTHGAISLFKPLLAAKWALGHLHSRSPVVLFFAVPPHYSFRSAAAEERLPPRVIVARPKCSRVSIAAPADMSVEKALQPLFDADLVILDELGFTPMGKILSDHFYRIVARRYERGAILITSNKSFEHWGEVFADAVIATAILDRLIHHAHLIAIPGESFRMKAQKSKQAKIIKAAA